MTPAVVAISGSCGTRDNFNSRFNPTYKRWFSCDLATNQSSIIALASPPVDEEFTPDHTLSAYDVWNVRNDLNREFLDQLEQLRPAHLVLDFFGDVHFGVLRLPDGRYVTNNRWKLQHTDLYPDLVARGSRALTIQGDTEEYLAVWKESMDRFAAEIARRSPDTVVTVHRGLNIDRVVVPERAAPIALRRHRPVQPLDVALSNRLWAELDDHCLDSFGWESIDLRDEGYTSYAEHPWGAFYVHYTPDYYHRFLAELHKIHLRRYGLDADPDDVRDRMLEIEAAARERGETRLALSQSVRAAQRRRLRERDARVAELESLTPLRAARYALGQRLRARTARKESR